MPKTSSVVDMGPVVLRPTAFTRAQAQRALKGLGYDIALHPGRAVIQAPGEGYAVEISYRASVKSMTALAHSLERFSVVGELPIEVNFGPYAEALVLKLLSEPRAMRLQLPDHMPQVGQPFDRDFYLQIIGLYNRFRDEAVAYPCAEIADLMTEKLDEVVLPDQVRTWVSRGKKRLEEGN